MTKVKLPSISENEDLKKEFAYPTELEFNLNRPLVIGVQGPYEFVVLNEKTYIVSSKLKEKFLNEEKLDSGHDIKTKLFEANSVYNPFEKFDIEHFLNTVISIDLKDSKSILEFYNAYGPLGIDSMGSDRGEINSALIRMFGLHLDTNWETFDFFKKEITFLQHHIQLYEALQNQDVEFIRNFEFLTKYAMAAPSEKVINETTSKDKLFILAKRALLFLINEKSTLMNPVVYLSPENEFVKGTTSYCLLGVFYLRFYELVTENNKMKKCRYCGDYFIPRKSNANFCPPPEANERSKCANRYDAMVRRIAEWHFKEGLTIEEIQEKLTKPKSRTIREIQHILANYKGKLKK